VHGNTRPRSKTRRSGIELVSTPVPELIHPDCREAVLAAIERIGDGKINSSDAERRYLRKDGVGAFSRHRRAPERRSIDHFVGAPQDISKRKRAGEELRKREEPFRLFARQCLPPCFDGRKQILPSPKSAHGSRIPFGI
jgi:PAS domain-containing protein